ncbi:hypothetical protein WM40_02000 [Robbsia andropogonis]|uniref:Uncharacterized protein n=1 Tax=Robbsia andropogonis TaxID=28092 RepID=A0A0F5K4M0_9BURK|nr:hypothetical protein WM40_02000 [Robbsia andropogonis]
MALSKTLFHQHHFAPYRPNVMLQRVKRRNAGTRIQPRLIDPIACRNTSFSPDTSSQGSN